MKMKYCKCRGSVGDGNAAGTCCYPFPLNFKKIINIYIKNYDISNIFINDYIKYYFLQYYYFNS